MHKQRNSIFTYCVFVCQISVIAAYIWIFLHKAPTRRHSKMYTFFSKRSKNAETKELIESNKRKLLQWRWRHFAVASARTEPIVSSVIKRVFFYAKQLTLHSQRETATTTKRNQIYRLHWILKTTWHSRLLSSLLAAAVKTCFAVFSFILTRTMQNTRWILIAQFSQRYFIAWLSVCLVFFIIPHVQLTAVPITHWA